jgi:hypothetical protein
MRAINRTGEVNGKLTVTHRAPSREGHSYWNCTCECGKAVTVASSNLKNTHSCGCGKEDYLAKGKWEEIVMRPHGYFTPIVFFPQSQRVDKSIGRNGYWLGRCTNCHSWVRATTTRIRTGQVMGCTVCDGKARERIVKGEFLWLRKAVQNTDTRASYYSTRRRCRDLTNMNYGGRGIKFCDRWNLPNGEGYRNFVEDMGLRPHRGLSLERVDPHGDYTPENCIWEDDPAQRRNKSTSRKFLVCGQEMNQCDIAAALGTSDKNLSRRIERLTASGLTERMALDLILADLHSVQHTSTPHQPKGLAA